MLKKGGLFGSSQVLNPYEFDGYVVCGEDIKYESDGTTISQRTIGYNSTLGSISPKSPLIVSVSHSEVYLVGMLYSSTTGIYLNRDLLVSDGLIRAFRVEVEGNGYSGECFAVPDCTQIFIGDEQNLNDFVYSDNHYELWEKLPTHLSFYRMMGGGSAGTMNLKFPMSRTFHNNNTAFGWYVYSGSTKLTAISPLSFENAKNGDVLPFKLKILEEVFS